MLRRGPLNARRESLKDAALNVTRKAISLETATSLCLLSILGPTVPNGRLPPSHHDLLPPDLRTPLDHEDAALIKDLLRREKPRPEDKSLPGTAHLSNLY